MRYNPIRSLNAHPCRPLPNAGQTPRIIEPRYLRNTSPTISARLHKWWTKKTKAERINLAKKIPVAFAVVGLIAVVADAKIRDILLRRGGGGERGGNWGMEGGEDHAGGMTMLVGGGTRVNSICDYMTFYH
ncbi:403c4379-5d5f-4c86-b16a-0481e5ca0e0d-CDS [Sclerotinia trifoliorum]|uniref:403c4379-5d5f-4c86-b16a-0481e5ca0e0d-CDS n=1 Tax=Sclerotinia trifoliorum TaxID=28548 RepID=A0A8H2VNA0_9HELO|nr:403c4379-5d5f-4c86-b16a-0481e5ca0e0d-CDS [Sclerotinia trifoliorum]